MKYRASNSLSPERVLLVAIAGCLLLLLAACTPQGFLAGADEAVPPIVGKVVFPTYRVQATIGDVASASSVVLIDAATNTSLSTTLTDANGNFSLSFGKGFKPIMNPTYYVEAMKGLGNNMAGKDAARVRTMLQFNAGWKSLTSPIVNNPIYLNEGTTALSVIASLKGAGVVAPDTLIGSLTVSPEIFTPITNVSLSEFNAVRSLVSSLLVGNNDPVAGINYEPGSPGRFYPSVSGSGLTVTPTTCDFNQTITLQGLTFDTTLTNNVVTFTGGVMGNVTGISADRQSLYVLVPAGATTGMVTVSLNGQVYGIPSLTILGTLNAGLY